MPIIAGSYVDTEYSHEYRNEKNKQTNEQTPKTYSLLCIADSGRESLGNQYLQDEWSMLFLLQENIMLRVFVIGVPKRVFGGWCEEWSGEYSQRNYEVNPEW